MTLLVSAAVWVLSTASAPQNTPKSNAGKCDEALAKLCPMWQPKQQCQLCAGIHQHDLRVADCTPDEVRDFCIFGNSCGAVPVSCAPNCAGAIAKSLMDCSASGGGTVTLSAGIYHCNDAAIADHQPMLKLSGLKNVALVGATSSGDFHATGPDPTATTLLIYGMKAAFSISSSSNIQITNIQIDMERQPYTFGKCTAVTPTSFTLTCTLYLPICSLIVPILTLCYLIFGGCLRSLRHKQLIQKRIHFRRQYQIIC